MKKPSRSQLYLFVLQGVTALKKGARFLQCNNYSKMLRYADNRYDSSNKFLNGGHIYVCRTD